MAKEKSKPKNTKPVRAFSVRTDRFPASAVGRFDIQTGQRIPESKREYDRMVERMGFVR